MSITVSSWGHSAVRIENARGRLAIDPGVFSDPQVLEGVDAVLVTHEHPDHVIVDGLAARLTANTNMEAWGPESVVTQLAEAGAPRDRIHVATAGQSFTTAGFDVQAFGGDHAVIHPALPHSANVAYLVDGRILHPGDSLSTPPESHAVEVLFVPVSAPWLKLAEAVDYVVAVQPEVAVPIHDGDLTEPGRMLTDQVMGLLTGAVEYRRLAAGETHQLN